MLEQLPVSGERPSNVANITKRYETLNMLHRIYNNKLQEEGTKRELEKQHHFNNSLLNIKLSKFKDYDSATDDHLFQGNFEKCSLKFAPNLMLADLLNNNFLKDPALPLVKSVGSSHPEVFCKKGVLRNFTKFTGKRPCQSHFFNKVVGLKPATLLKKRFCHSCFPVNFVKFLRTPFIYRIPPVAASEVLMINKTFGAKGAYGNTRTMLTKKLEELSNFDGF